jgi:hypothetical protein
MCFEDCNKSFKEAREKKIAFNKHLYYALLEKAKRIDEHDPYYHGDFKRYLQIINKEFEYNMRSDLLPMSPLSYRKKVREVV